MMEAKDDLDQCCYCKKDVAKVNLAMHEAHCQRFLCVCPDCDELVPKEQLEDHRVEQHTPVHCKKCNMKMERRKLGDHEENDCPKRLQSCEFCELELPVSSLKEHEVACGSRTERCPDCNQYVILKDQLHHAQICSSALIKDDHSDNEEFISEDVKPLPDSYLQDSKLGVLSVDQSDLQDNPSTDPKSGQGTPSNSNPSFSFLQKSKNYAATSWGDADEISTCPHCHLALPLRTLQWHQNKCKIYESLKLMKSQK